MKIYLIGLPGSGKTTIGINLANELGLAFFDIDKIIEDEENSLIEDIFQTQGEEYFRFQEINTLKKLQVNKNCVISCGGGIVLNDQNKEYMNGIKIYLNTNINVIEERLKMAKTRPMLKKYTIQQIFDQRYQQYKEFSDVIVANNVDINTTVKVIKNFIKEEIKEHPSENFNN